MSPALRVCNPRPKPRVEEEYFAPVRGALEEMTSMVWRVILNLLSGFPHFVQVSEQEAEAAHMSDSEALNSICVTVSNNPTQAS